MATESFEIGSSLKILKLALEITTPMARFISAGFAVQSYGFLWRVSGMSHIRLAVIGCGGYFRNSHGRALSEGDAEKSAFQIVALVDPNPENIARLKKERFPRRRIADFADHRSMLKEIRPDAVIVASPHTMHFRHAYDSIRAGAHVMVEKPMVTSSTDARKLVAAAEKARKVLQIGIQGTYTDTFAYARKLLRDGTVGDIQLVTGVLAQSWMKGTSGSWRQNPKLSGGGQLYDSTSHVLSAMIYLIDSPVVEAFCWADNCGTPVDINAVGCIKFANGAMATITSGGNCPTWRSHIILQGSNARLEVSAHGGDFIVTGKNIQPDITGTPKKWIIPTVSCSANFADAIRGLAEPRCPGELGIRLAELMDALYASAETGKPVKVARCPA